MHLCSTDPCLDTARELELVHSGHQSLDQTLHRVVVSIANRMQTDVGSLYLVDHDGSLVLSATVGLLHSCVGSLRMHFDEGLVGLVAQQRLPVVLAHAPKHPRFKYFPEADEDEYQSFLGVPILTDGVSQGVLVVQTIEPRQFTAIETGQLVSVAELLGPFLCDYAR